MVTKVSPRKGISAKSPVIDSAQNAAINALANRIGRLESRGAELAQSAVLNESIEHAPHKLDRSSVKAVESVPSVRLSVDHLSNAVANLRCAVSDAEDLFAPVCVSEDPMNGGDVSFDGGDLSRACDLGVTVNDLARHIDAITSRVRSLNSRCQL